MNFGWSSEQPGLMEDVPAHGRGAGTRWSLRSLPTLTILWFYNIMKENRLSERENGWSFQSKRKTTTLFIARLEQGYSMLTIQKWSEKYWDLSNTKPHCCILVHWYSISVHTLNCQRHFAQYPRIPGKSLVPVLTTADCQAGMQHFDAHIHTSRWHFVSEGSQSSPILGGCQHAESCSTIQNLICKKKNQ